MRYALAVLLAAFALPWSAFGKVPDVEEGVAFEALPHVWRQILVNHAATRLVAFHEPFHCPQGGHVITYDACFSPGIAKLAPVRALRLGQAILPNARGA